ncbi:hypothetical protein KP509_38G016800 [Ceratopteris richardii]|nr:hypothetical protein KP509_38G016800 [Ceratopteris richardii]
MERLRSDGNIRLQSLDACIAGVEGWASPPGDNFLVRGPDYFTSRTKVHAGDCLLKSVAFDWIRSSSKISEVLRHPNSRIHAAMKKAGSSGYGSPPFFWAFNLQVPSKDNYSAIAYFVSMDPIPEDSMMGRFIRGDDGYRNSRLKLIANIVNGPWIVRAAVGEQAICILGRAVSCKYHHGDNFLEVDVDIGASILANAVVHLAFGYVTFLTVDLAFLIESQNDEELPEKLLGTIRFGNLDPASAVCIDVKEDQHQEGQDGVTVNGSKYSDEPPASSLTGRWWKSFSTYINGEEPPAKANDNSDSSSSGEG